MFPTTRRRQGLSLLLTATLLLATAGCGSDSDGDQPESAAASAQDTALKYAKCMRENGIDMPDPEAGPDGATMALALPDASDGMEQMNRAIEACKQFQPKAPQMTPEQRQAATDEALKLAKCMREHGVDMPDPSADGTSMPGVAADDPNVEAAAKACSGPGGTASWTRAVPAP